MCIYIYNRDFCVIFCLEEWFRNGRIIIWIYKREGQRRQVSGK